MLDGVRPSYATGFAQWPGMSEYPHLWRGLVGAWCPPLGMTGSRLLDWSGKGIHGTLVGNTAWVPGKFGPCLSFNGTGDYVGLGFQKYLIGGLSQVSVAAWISTGEDNTIAASREIVSQFGTGYDSIRLAYDATEDIYFTVNDTTHTSYSARAVDFLYGKPRASYFLVGVMDGGYVRLYIDGIERATPTAWPGGVIDTPNFSTNHLLIGNNMLGLIHAVMIYNRGLSASEIQQLNHLQRRLA